MKTKIFILVLSLIAATLWAQQKEPAVVKLRGTRLTYPLVNKWIEEFNKEYPNIRVLIAPTAPADSIDFSIASYELKSGDLKETHQAVVTTRYVQLPIVNSNRPGLAELQARGITEKNLGELFFATETPSVFAIADSKTPVDLYVRDKPVCAVKAFAGHFGFDPKRIKGNGINGDDQDLARAVKKDVNGFCFNNLGFIYEVKTRRVNDSLAILPLDLNENGKVDPDEQIYDTLDEVIAFIEKTKNPAFVNERVNFIFNKNTTNKSAGLFLFWILAKGQQFNHDLGFINPIRDELNEQERIASATFISVASCLGSGDLAILRNAKNTD